MKTVLLSVVAVLLTGCGQKIQHGLDEGQANEIEALLSSSGIEAKKVAEGGRDAKWAIEVPEERVTSSIKLLADHELPRQKAPGFGEIFGKGSMVPTAVEENALFVHALSGEISRTLAAVEGVVSARVHLVTAPSSVHSSLKPPTRARASVLLKVRHGESSAVELRRTELQELVAGSVEGLEPSSVSLMVTELPVAPVVSLDAPRFPPLRLALIGAAGLIALLSVGLTLAGLRLRSMRITLGPSEAAVEDGSAVVKLAKAA